MSAEAPVQRPKVPSVTQALAALRHLAEYPGPLGVNALARALGIGPSSCFNILKTLEAEEFVRFDLATKTYTLGGGAILLARRSLDPHQHFELARPLLLPLANRHDATCLLWRVVDNERLVMIGYVDGRDKVRLHLTVGQRIPLPMGATGRAVVAALGVGEERLREIFDGLHWQRPPTLAHYIAEVEEARRRGWACDEGSYMREVTTIGAPILDDAGRPRYALGAFTLRTDVSDDEKAVIGADVVAVTEQISGLLFGRFKRATN